VTEVRQVDKTSSKHLYKRDGEKKIENRKEGKRWKQESMRTSKAPGTGADDIQADIAREIEFETKVNHLEPNLNPNPHPNTNLHPNFVLIHDDIQATIERTSKAILSTFRRQSDATLKHLLATIERTSKAILSTFRRQSDATLKHLLATIERTSKAILSTFRRQSDATGVSLR
jgi:hypothetical protein